MTMHIGRALTAQLTLLACLVGLPWLLAVTVGDPLRGLGARWTRVLWPCWTSRTPYNPDLHHRSRPEPAAS